MRPVYVCQLPDEMQREIRGILTRLLLYQCGTEEKAEKYFDMSLADAVQAEIIRLRTEMETDSPFLYHAKEQIDGREYYELVNVFWHHGEDDYGLWQVQLPVYLVRNILNSPQSFIGDVDEIMDGVPVEQEPSDNTLHFLFPRGGKIACCSMEMEEQFFEEYSTHGTSVRGSREDIRQDLEASLEVDETFQEER